MPYKKFLIIATAFALFAAAGFAGFYGPEWMKTREQKAISSGFAKPEMNKDVFNGFAREFAVARIADTPITLPDDIIQAPGGKSIQISDFKGKPLLVNFWATWCAPCVVELPTLKRFTEHYDGKIQVIGVALETGKDQKQIADFLEKRGLGQFAGYFDKEGGFSRKLGLTGIPTSFLIGSDGLILYRFEGDADWTSAASKAFFDEYLKSVPPHKDE